MKKYITIVLLAFSTFGFAGAQVTMPQLTSSMTIAPVGDVEDTQLTCTDLKNTLKLRSRDATTNNEVTALQDFLLDIGLLDTDPTGYFGASTLKAVKTFQKQSGLINSGLVGEYTRKAIKDKSCGKNLGTTISNQCLTNPSDPSCNTLYSCNGAISHDPNCKTSQTCNSEQYLDANGECKYITKTCPNGKVITGNGSCTTQSVGNLLTVFRNGQEFKTIEVYTKDDAYRKCKDVINENTSAAMVVQVFKCTWGGEVIYTPSSEVLEIPKTVLRTLSIYKNSELLTRVASITKDDAYRKCKLYQGEYPTTLLKCLWGDDVIYATNSEVYKVDQRGDLGTLIVYKGGEEIKRGTLVTKDDAYNKCKYVQASYPSSVIKCTWNDGVIYVTNESVLEKDKESLNEYKYLNVNGSQIPEGQSILGASTMCVNLLRNFHRGDESDDTRALQAFLIANEFMIDDVTGFYGDKTVEAVKRYQRIKGLPETGMVYDLTRMMIMNETCR